MKNPRYKGRRGRKAKVYSEGMYRYKVSYAEPYQAKKFEVENDISVAPKLPN